MEPLRYELYQEEQGRKMLSEDYGKRSSTMNSSTTSRYENWMRDRQDIFIADVTRTVQISKSPFYEQVESIPRIGPKGPPSSPPVCVSLWKVVGTFIKRVGRLNSWLDKPAP